MYVNLRELNFSTNAVELYRTIVCIISFTVQFYFTITGLDQLKIETKI